MVKIKKLLAFMLVIIVSFCFIGCGKSDEEIESEAKEMLAIDKAVITKDTTCYDGERVVINVLELQMENGDVYQFVPKRVLQDSSDSFEVINNDYDFFAINNALRIARDNSLEGKDVYLDCDKEEKYGYVVDFGAINGYSVLYVSPDLYAVLVDKLCNSRENDVIYDSDKANLPTMSDEQKEFIKDLSEDIKVEED